MKKEYMCLLRKKERPNVLNDQQFEQGSTLYSAGLHFAQSVCLLLYNALVDKRICPLSALIKALIFCIILC